MRDCSIKNVKLIERLLTLREKKGVSQKTVAEYLGIKPDSYGKYEQGLNTPPSDKINKLADFYGTTPEYILTGKKQEPSDEINWLLRDFEPEMQDKLMESFRQMIRIFKEK